MMLGGGVGGDWGSMEIVSLINIVVSIIVVVVLISVVVFRVVVVVAI